MTLATILAILLEGRAVFTTFVNPAQGHRASSSSRAVSGTLSCIRMMQFARLTYVNLQIPCLTSFIPLSSFTAPCHIPETMSESTFHTTKEDIRKAESQVSNKNDGKVPAESEVSQMKVSLQPFMMYFSLLITLQSVIDNNSKPKSEVIEERRSGLPLPEDPPVASDWDSNDVSKVNVGSGGVESDVSYGGGSSSLRGPATSDSSVRTDGETFNTHAAQPSGGVGRQGHDNLDGLPQDAKAK